MYTKSEISFLIKNYPDKGKMWCARKLNKSEASIRYKTADLGLKKDINGSWFKKWQSKAAKSKVGKKRPEHSKLMKKLYREGRIPGMGRNSDVDIKVQSERMKKWIKENGHPRGMLGKTHSDEFKVGASNRSRKMWDDPKSIVNSNKYRNFLSKRAMQLRKDGVFGATNYSRAKMGTYEINGKKLFFRSAWEANYALYLDFLVKQKQIEKWEYEVDTFWFEKIRRGVRSYKPDFKVFRKNGSFYYDEVKGYMDSKSKTKIKRMAKYYPEVTLNVIDEPCYKEIKKKLGKILKFY